MGIWYFDLSIVPNYVTWGLEGGNPSALIPILRVMLITFFRLEASSPTKQPVLPNFELPSQIQGRLWNKQDQVNPTQVREQMSVSVLFPVILTHVEIDLSVIMQAENYNHAILVAKMNNCSFYSSVLPIVIVGIFTSVLHTSTTSIWTDLP